MARTHNKLTTLTVARALSAGMHSDGGGLYLQVTRSGARSWIFRYHRHGRLHDMGLGSYETVSLALAREKAGDARRLLLDGADPIEAKRANVRASALASAAVVTFKVAAEQFVAANKSGWRNAKHGAQWLSTLETYAFPTFGQTNVASVDTAMVVRVLQPIWSTKNQTARRVRGRIESILDWARAGGYRAGENPARWRGLLEHMLPRRPQSALIKHHPALHFSRIGAFMHDLRKQNGTAARALELAILTAARTGEVIGARKSEFDLDRGIWTVPANRIKAAREHRVPLSAAALAIVRTAMSKSTGDYLFDGGRKDKPLSNMAMAAVLKRMERDDITVHGFRSTFRDWAAEVTNHPREVAEMALAHAVGNRIEAAYRRGDLFIKRQLIMTDWARFCSRIRASDAPNVVSMRRSSRGDAS